MTDTTPTPDLKAQRGIEAADTPPAAAPKRRLRKSKPRSPDWAAGNAAKFFGYAEAWTRISRATKSGYFLEAVTIEESIVSDRLLSFLQKTCGLTLHPRVTRTFSKVIERWEKEFEARLSDAPELMLASRALHERLDTWRERRNDVVHGLVKSTVGKTDDHIENFLVAAELAAIEGKAVARAISSWVDAAKKREPKT